MGLDMFLFNRGDPKEVEEVAYWRKANAIHKWFVENVQGGVDDCGAYPVQKADLKKLLSLVNKSLRSKKLAPKLLPTQSGFFFGSTEYGEWFFQDLNDTKKKLTEILKSDNAPDGWLYQSSW